jgi:hypothetical protein
MHVCMYVASYTGPSALQGGFDPSKTNFDELEKVPS